MQTWIHASMACVSVALTQGCSSAARDLSPAEERRCQFETRTLQRLGLPDVIEYPSGSLLYGPPSDYRASSRLGIANWHYMTTCVTVSFDDDKNPVPAPMSSDTPQRIHWATLRSADQVVAEFGQPDLVNEFASEFQRTYRPHMRAWDQSTAMTLYYPKYARFIWLNRGACIVGSLSDEGRESIRAFPDDFKVEGGVWAPCMPLSDGQAQ